MTEQADLFGAKAARDIALEQVSQNSTDWQRQCLLRIREYPGDRATGEQLRLWLSREVGHPHHHNAWGALIKKAISWRLLSKTGQRENMQTRKSHARATDVYWVRHG